MLTINNQIKDRKWDYADMARWIITNVLHRDNILLNIVDNKSILEKMSTKDIEYKAFLYRIAPHAYALYTTRSAMEPIVLCHEMQHLEQYESGILNVLLNGNAVWKGKVYTKDYAYASREWESEAFAKQKEYFKKYKDARAKNKTQQTVVTSK